ncbi:hypothetical protein ACNOYE_34540 [Nannocystaceae bacterium ST9]
MSDSTSVEIHGARNKGMAIYLGTLALAGVTIFALTAHFEWGFAGWMGGSLLLLAGLGGIAGMAKTGGAGLATCPKCGHANPVLHVSEHRYLCCAGCKTWLEGSTQTHVVADDHVAKYPAFQLALASPQLAWPEGCPVCGGPVTRHVEIEGTDVIGDVFAMVAPVSVQKVSKLQAPCCDQHADGVAVHREGGEVIVGFRSLAYWRRFMAINDLRPR